MVSMYSRHVSQPVSFKISFKIFLSRIQVFRVHNDPTPQTGFSKAVSGYFDAHFSVLADRGIHHYLGVHCGTFIFLLFIGPSLPRFDSQ